MQFRWQTRQTDPPYVQEERIRFVHANLVDFNQNNIAIDILNTLESFNLHKKASTPETEAAMLEKRNQEPSKKGDDTSDMSSESSSFRGGHYRLGSLRIPSRR